MSPRRTSSQPSGAGAGTRRLAAGATAVILGLGACSGPGSPTGTADHDADHEVSVFAAASLTEAFSDLADERVGDGQTPPADVRFSFDGSSGLVDQLAGGARADVLATADAHTMDRAVELGLVESEPTTFATNRLAIAVEPGNPLGLDSLDDLDGDRDSLRLVVCSPAVPCGAEAARVAADAGVGLAPVSEENSVSDVVGKVASGEADAGLVYETSDVPGIDVVPLGAAADPGVELRIAPVAGADAEAARSFIDSMTGPDGREVLARHGFGSP